MSAYTRAMARCLAECADAEDSELVHSLTNLVQGRLLEFLAGEISRIHDITDDESRARMVTALLGIFSDEFFALFRSKLEQRPELAVLIARRIIRGEREATEGPPRPGRRSLERLFPAIFRKYFEYRKLDSLLHIVETDAEIQKIILLAELKQRSDPLARELLLEVTDILEEDAEGLCPNLFLSYVEEDRLPALKRHIRSGAWRSAREDLRERVTAICGG